MQIGIAHLFIAWKSEKLGKRVILSKVLLKINWKPDHILCKIDRINNKTSEASK